MARVDLSDSGKIQDIAMASEEEKKKMKKESKKKKTKEEKKRKRKERESSDVPSTTDEASGKNVDHDEKEGNDDDAPPPSSEKSDEKKEKSKEERRLEREQKKASKKAEKSSLLDKVPKTDEHGISYTKIQIRRMLRRVKRGLPPVPTEAEEQERLKEIRKEKALEEEELAGMMFDREKEAGGGESEEDEGAGDDEDVSDDAGGEGAKDDTIGDNEVAEHRIPAKKKKTNKPVPSDYVCQACKNKHSPPHWIYDCPDKVRRPGSNQVKKNRKGINPPDPRKVYVSGMPFGVKQREVKSFFEETAKCGKIEKCHLVTFKDEFKRCKGEAFLTFETEEGAKKAISTSGETMAVEEKKGKGASKQGDDDAEKKKLRLKVTKVVNKITERRRNQYFSQWRKG